MDNKVIDEINILNAARQAFEKALAGLKVQPAHIYTDAMDIDTDIPYTSLIKGDAKVYTIAAASIVAKVTRDRIMREYDKKYPYCLCTGKDMEQKNVMPRFIHMGYLTYTDERF